MSFAAGLACTVALWLGGSLMFAFARSTAQRGVASSTVAMPLGDTSPTPGSSEAHAWAIIPTTIAAVALVSMWFALQLARFIGEAPDLDAMISLREALVFHREGLRGLVAASAG